MLFSKTAEYALRILSFMAKEDIELFPADYLHKKLDIPQRYLRRLMTDPIRSGLILSIRGRNGGFSFAKDPSGIYVSDIITTIDGSNVLNPCIMGFEECALKNPCPMHELWKETHERIINTLTSVTLSYMDRSRASLK